MKTLYKIVFISFILAGLGISCSDEFLEPKPLSFFAPENAFVNAAGFDAALVACLRNTRHEYFGDSAPMITEMIFSDIAVEGTTDKTGPAMDLPLQIQPFSCLYSNNCNKIGWYWAEQYRRIRYANVVVSRIDNAEYANEAERNNVLGKAYFHIARSYYRLVHQFGDVPLILGEITSPRLDFYTVSRESILRKCKRDLEFAVQWIKNESETGVIGDVTDASAYHLLTKVNLALGEFDDAIASSSAVLNDGNYALMQNRFGIDSDDISKDVVWDLHQVENKALNENTERLYLMIAREGFEEDNSSRSRIMRNMVPFWGGAINTPSGKRGTRDVAGLEIDLLGIYGRGIGRARSSAYNYKDIWENANNDLRFKDGNWVEMEDLLYNHPSLKDGGDEWYGKNLRLFSDNGDLLAIDTIRTWYGWPNYKTFVPDPTSNRPDGGRGDWYLYRLAETYLLRAEAYYWKGNLASAADDINQVRMRAQADPINSADVNIDMILNERARELYYEEPRKTELTRMSYIFAQTGKAAYNGKSYSLSNFSQDNFWYDRVIEKNNFYRDNVEAPFYTYRAAPHIVLWPIPGNAIADNSQGIINQNEGYNDTGEKVKPYTWVDGEGEGTLVP